MSYDTYIARRQARIAELMARNPSVRSFIETLTRKLTDHAAEQGTTFARLTLDQPYVVNHTGDEVIRARILRG